MVAHHHELSFPPHRTEAYGRYRVSRAREERKEGMEKKSGSAPATGCYKCGRAGHWSRDCPFSTSDNAGQVKQAVAAEKPAQALKVKKKIRRTLTPDLVLSNEGLGYVLEHMPRMVQIKGRRHEVCPIPLVSILVLKFVNICRSIFQYSMKYNLASLYSIILTVPNALTKISSTPIAHIAEK